MNAITKSLRAGAKLLAAPHFIVKGVEKRSKSPLSLIWSGPEEHRAYFIDRLFEPDTGNVTPLGRASLHSLNSLLHQNGCMVGLIVGPSNLVNRIARPSDLLLPLWVECSVELDRDRLASPSRDVKRSISRFHRDGFKWQISTNPEDVTFFFNSIYLPTIQKSHGRSALPASLDQRLLHVKRGAAELIQVFERDTFVAGLIVDYRGNIPALREIGVLGGSDRLKRHGLIPSLNQIAFEHLHTKGHLHASLGLSRCFLDDGVLQFKRKFRPKISGTSDDSILIRISDMTGPIRSMLCISSFFSYEEGQLTRTFFQDSHFQTRIALDNNSLLDWDFGVQAMQVIDLSASRLTSCGQA